MRRTVIVMVKEPRPGRVKTRLGREIGMTGAAWWYRHQTARLLRRVRDRRWNTVLAVAPDGTVQSSREWPAIFPRIPQGRGDLGDRMGRLIRGVSPGPILLIGSDIPDVDRRVLATAFADLRGRDAVFGPARDGGYWLVGARAPHILPKRAFHGVRWSSRHALKDTERTLRGLRIAQTTTLADVDTAADLAAHNLHDAPGRAW